MGSGRTYFRPHTLNSLFMNHNKILVPPRLTWATQLDPAFEQLYTAIRMPNDRLTYGDLKTNPTWDPLRKDPRFEKLLAQLAPDQSLSKPPSSASRVRNSQALSKIRTEEDFCVGLPYLLALKAEALHWLIGLPKL